MNEADPGAEPPDPQLENGNNNDGGSADGNGTGDVDEDEDDEADGDVTGPTVEAHVDLAKTARKNCVTILLEFTNFVYSIQSLPG